MPIWDLRQLQQNLERKNISPLFLVWGDEEFLVSESLKLIKKAVLENGSVDFNYDQFFAGTDDTDKIIDVIGTLPMMSDRRLILVKNIEKFKDKDWQILAPALSSPYAGNCLVLVAPKIDKRKKYYKAIVENGQEVELKKPYDNQILAWIEYLAHQNEVELGRDAALLLQQLVGSNLSDLNNEIKKLKDFILGKNAKKLQITTEDVLAVVSKSKVDSIFQLTDAIGKRDKVLALISLANLLEHGQNEVGTLMMIHRHVRILRQMKDGLRENIRGAKLCAKVGVPSVFLQKYLDQVQLWNERHLSDTVIALHETDKALKSSPLSAHIWLENFILKTCN